MQISNISSSVAAAQTNRSGNNLPTEQTEPSKAHARQQPLHELAATLNPENMSRQEAMNLANALMQSGEGELSLAFLPPPLFRINDDGSISDLRGTPEGDARMNEKFNMFETLNERIQYRKTNNQPTNILEDAIAFLEKLQISKATTRVDSYS
jgi:hypothetical protein